MPEAPKPIAPDPEHVEMLTRVEDDHRDLRAALDHLASAASFEDIATRLRELPEALAEHFDEEEAPGGLFDGLRRRRPAVESDLAILCSEHELLRHQVDALLERARTPAAASDSKAEFVSLHEDALAFIDLLRRHERLETRLVSEIYYSEDGVSG